MTRVCHISPVHDLVDNRIFYKQCCSLRDAGYDVQWVVTHERDEVIDGVNVIGLKRPVSRTDRWLRSGWNAFRRARATKSDIYHFHDPEFIPWAILLRLLGNRVVYDIHEDYESSISQKFYIPALVRKLVSKLAGGIEVLLSKFFTCVIAEKYYADRFPNAVNVLNYPRIRDDATACKRSPTRLLYTGKVHLYRGAKIHAKIPALVNDCTVSFIGRCAPDLHQELGKENAEHLSKLSFQGIGEFVPFQEIDTQYREGEWLAGLAVFPPNEHLERKELTKFFEYMQYGLPIIASNFPTWRRLVEENGCGICVDPNDDQQIADAVNKLQNEPNLWSEMSQNGIRTVREKFSWASQEDSLLALYDKLLDHST